MECGGNPINTANVTLGLYGITQIKDIVEVGNSNNLLEVSKVNGLITLTIGAGQEFLFTDGLLSLLGLDDGLMQAHTWETTLSTL